MKISTIPVPPRGPEDASLLILGEAPGANEEIYRKPFIGASGEELNRILIDAELHPASIRFLNTFPFRPENNNIEHYFLPKKEGDQSLPPLKPGKFLNPQARPLLDATLVDILSYPSARIIVPLGNTALWALTGLQGITKYRGTWQKFKHLDVFPTLHPSAILRRWQDRPTVVADFIRVKEALQNGPPSSPTYSLQLNPSLSDLETFLPLAASASLLAVDIETANKQIRSVGFAVSPTHAFVIPFFDKHGSYWDTLSEELAAWKVVRDLLALPVPKVFHNGLYDIQYLWKVMGIPVTNALHDTMLLHHSLQPEMQKSLAYLGSVYTNNPAWKMDRPKHKSLKEGE